MENIDSIIDRDDINEIIQTIVQKKSEEIKEELLDAVVCSLIDVLEIL